MVQGREIGNGYTAKVDQCALYRKLQHSSSCFAPLLHLLCQTGMCTSSHSWITISCLKSDHFKKQQSPIHVRILPIHVQQSSRYCSHNQCKDLLAHRHGTRSLNRSAAVMVFSSMFVLHRRNPPEAHKVTINC